MPFIRMRDGRELYVRTVGRGTPVLLLPGLGMNSFHWLPFVLPYLARHRFYLPDFRGFGRSSHLRIESDDVFASHASDVRDVIERCELDDFLLGGISLGCTTALHLLRDYGFKGVSRYLHIDQSPCVANRDGWSHGLFGVRQTERFADLRRALTLLEAHPKATRLGEIPPPARNECADLLSRIMAAIAGDETRATRLRAALLSPISRLLPLSQLDDVRCYLRAYLDRSHDYREVLRGCRTPMTLMIGMQSALYAAEGQLAIAALAGDVNVVPFERSGHVPLLDEPLKFTRELGRWLQPAKAAFPLGQTA